LYNYNEIQRFVAHHGLQETVTTKVKTPPTHDSAYGYTRESVRVREVPGISPGIITLLLSKTVFLKLADLGQNLPPYVERRLPIPLDSRFSRGSNDLNKIYEAAVKLAREGHMALLSSWTQATLGWFDCPIQETLWAKDKNGKVLDAYTVQGLLPSSDTLLDPASPESERYLLRNLATVYLQASRSRKLVPGVCAPLSSQRSGTGLADKR
jgi:hypothetical protein